MKRVSIVLIALLCTDILKADFLSVSIGGGYERQDISGYVKNGNTINYFNNSSAESDGNINSGNLGLDNKNNPFIWLKIIHPIPVLPDIKFQYTKYHSTGHSNYVKGNVKIFGDASIPAALTNIDTKMDINSYDVTFFYEFNPLVADIEIGAGTDIWDGKLKIYDNIAKKEIVNQNFTVILPYLYGHIETNHIFGFSALATVKWAKAGDNHHYDYLGALKYTFDVSGPIDPFIKVGYRYKEAYGVDGDNTTKLKYKGYFAEIGAEF